MRAPILIVFALIGLTYGVAIPVQRRATLDSAASEVRTMLLLARMRAAERDHDVGIRFLEIKGVWHHILYDDGNGDGLRRSDIARGIDPPAAPPYPVLEPGNVVIESVDELCIFTPNGSASPCVIAIVDDAGHREFVTQRSVS